MSCAVILSNLVSRAIDADFPTFQFGSDRLGTSIRILPTGTYTITATVPEGVTCYIRTTDSSDGDTVMIPATGEITLPYTLTLSSVRKVDLYFGYAGFRDEPYGTWTDIDKDDVQSVHAAKSGAPAHDIYDTVIIRPDEISENDTISKAICAKSSIAITLYPQFEAWGFAKRGETLVRVIDTKDGMIFRGRVSKINDRMSTVGLQTQVLTCISSADFMEETGYTGDIAMQGLAAWLGEMFAEHNTQVELARRLTFTLTGTAKAFTQEYLVESNYKALSDVLTGGKYLSRNTETFVRGYKMEWWERYYNDVTHIDIAEKLGEDCDTAILIGDNLKEINIERGLDGGIYSAVMAVSGVCSDGYRMEYVAYNDEMYTRYGGGRQRVIINDNIYFTGAGGREPRPDGGWNWYATPEAEAARAALKAFAEREAAKLSDPPIKITLTAADLAKMGYTGYEPFEVYNTYPVVYPSGGLFGRRMRLTALTRRLSDGQITSMTVECGEKLSDSGGGTLSAQLSSISAKSGGDDAKVLGILNETTGGLNFDPLTQEEFDAITEKDDNTIYYVDDDGDISIYKGDTHISTGGGGDEPTIETAAVLTSEQMIYWAPDHELVPVDFRGGAHVYYSQPPAKIVIQKQHAIVGSPTAALVAVNDLYEEIEVEFSRAAATGKQKLRFYITQVQIQTNGGIDYYVYSTAVSCYQVDGGSEIFIGTYTAGNYGIPVGTTTAWGIGLVICVSQLASSGNQPINPICTVYVAAKREDSLTILGVPNISGSFFNPGATLEFLNDAERKFALGVAGIVEPAPEQSSGGEGE